MKRTNFVSMAFIAVLMVLVVSCTPLQEMGGYEDAPGTSRVYRNAPFGSQQVIVVERDPYTGQYYQVAPYGYYGGSAFQTNPYGYGYGYPGTTRGGYYRDNNRSTTRPVPRNTQPQQSPRQTSPSTQKAKDIIRGN